jgi:hypothetical protein
MTLKLSPSNALVAALAAAITLAGCGGSSHRASTGNRAAVTAATTATSTTPSRAAGPGFRTTATPSTVGCAAGARACITQSPQATVLGSTNLNINLSALIAHDQRTLLNPQVRCQSSSTYPVSCTMTAFDTTRHALVSGTAKILGVYTLTHTYVYQLNYAPATGVTSSKHRSKGL